MHFVAVRLGVAVAVRAAVECAVGRRRAAHLRRKKKKKRKKYEINNLVVYVLCRFAVYHLISFDCSPSLMRKRTAHSWLSGLIRFSI
jgi:hypothetical protein